ncbi:MAG TPA: hypothetical protein VHF89_13410 [Solirubrobacteraceae bacterium]|nr:hypothetical protein [Solirubrobacteraceae bacterium]
MSVLAELFWKEHQAFILVPLANYVRGTTLSKKAHSAIEHGMHDSPIPSPAADRPGASRSTPA